MHETGCGEHAFADSGFFVEAIDKAPEMVDALVKLYKLTGQKGDAALARRFMYGTDWEMVLTHGDVGDYLEDFTIVLKKMEDKLGEELAPQFFGGNAARWLGLAKGGATRERLKKFYGKHDVQEPDWVAKVDAIRPG